jgi:cyclopropane-fatty-acyl-phospholipid synthase
MTSPARQELELSAPPPPQDPRGHRALRILNTLTARYGPRDFAIRLWDGTVQPQDPGKNRRFTLVLNRPDVLWRMFAPPSERAIGEAYAYGEFDVEGDIMRVLDLVDVLSKLKVKDALPLLGDLWSLRTGASTCALPDAVLSGIRHCEDRDRAAIRHHYDVSRNFYALWLDKRMVYSCAYYPTGKETLDEAQEKKLEHICRKLRLDKGERHLDFGCGYGALVQFAAENFGTKSLGITLSAEHGKLAQENIKKKGLEDRCEVRILDYRQLPLSEPFDKISAIGIIEHVGEKRLPDYFRRVYQLLKPGGLFLNHGICKTKAKTKFERWKERLPGRENFILKYVFPDMELLPIHVLLRNSARAGLEVYDVENLRPHYTLTLKDWITRLDANWDKAAAEVGAPTARVWKAYLGHSVYAFDSGLVQLIQTLYGKRDSTGKVNIPPSRADIYR